MRATERKKEIAKDIERRKEYEIGNERWMKEKVTEKSERVSERERTCVIVETWSPLDWRSHWLAR